MIVRLLRVGLTSVFLIILSSVVLMQCANDTRKDENIILRPGNKEYEKVSKTFRISIEEAHKLLISKTRDRKEKYFDPTPYIVSDYYFFMTEPLKVGLNLQGYYVNGNTGEIQFRKSSIVARKKIRFVPAGAFSAVEIIQ